MGKRRKFAKYFSFFFFFAKRKEERKEDFISPLFSPSSSFSLRFPAISLLVYRITVYISRESRFLHIEDTVLRYATFIFFTHRISRFHRALSLSVAILDVFFFFEINKNMSESISFDVTWKDTRSPERVETRSVKINHVSRSS